MEKLGGLATSSLKKKSAKKALGSMLVKHAIDYLRGKGVETIGLYAYPNLRELLWKLGL